MHIYLNELLHLESASKLSSIDFLFSCKCVFYTYITNVINKLIVIIYHNKW